MTEEEIVNNGYRIYTELDQNYQASMQVIYSNVSLFPVAEDGTMAESGSVALDPKTGGVRALVGRVNSAEGSTFKSFNYTLKTRCRLLRVMCRLSIQFQDFSVFRNVHMAFNALTASL